MNKYDRHIRSLARKYRVTIKFDAKNTDGCYASPFHREIHTLPVKSPYSYVIALHEIGHVLSQSKKWMLENVFRTMSHNGQVTRFQMETERKAWLKAKKLGKWWNARMTIISVDQMARYIYEWEISWKTKMGMKEAMYYLLPRK
jgi:hypothetical protein